MTAEMACVDTIGTFGAIAGLAVVAVAIACLVELVVRWTK